MSLSFDGLRLGIGLAYENITLTGFSGRSGGASIYRRSGTGWALEAHVIPPASFAGDLAESLCISGDTLLMTAGRQLWAYGLKGTAWSKQAQIDVPYGNSYTAYDNSISMSGNVALVGQTTSVQDFYFTPQVVPLIRRGQRWTVLSPPTSLKGPNHSLFGAALALGSDFAVIGMPNKGSELTALDGSGDVRFVHVRRPPHLRVYDDKVASALQLNAGSTKSIGDIVADNPVFVDLVLTNEGISSLDSLAFQITGLNAADFQLVAPVATSIAPLTQRPLRLQVRAPSGAAGARTATLTITSNDPTAPAFIVNLQANAVAAASVPTALPVNADQIVALGQPALLSAALGGTQPATYQWLKDGRGILGATQQHLAIDSTALTSGGRYQVSVTNAAGKVTSGVLRLAVVGTMASVTQGLVNRTMVIKGPSMAGPDLIRHWKLGSSPLSDDTKYRGTQTGTLSVLNAQITDNGSYVLHITMGSASYDAGPLIASVLEKPVVTPPVITNWDVALPVDLTLTASPAATEFNVSGLPSGLKFNTATGRLTGRPTSTGIFHLSFSATNAAGTGPVVKQDVEVLKLGAFTAGEYRGFIERSRLCNASAGGNLVLTLSPLGTATGTLTDGQGARKFTVPFDRQAGGSTLAAQVTLAGQPATLLKMQIVPGSNTLTGQAEPVPVSLLGHDPAPALIAYRNGWADSAIAAPRAGSYVFTMRAATLTSSLPAGSGWATMTVSSRGAVTWSGHTSDGEAMTITTFLAPDLKVHLHTMMASYRASLLGSLLLPASGPITASFDWTRIGGTGRVYASGFPLHTLSVAGESYTATKTAFMPNLTATSPNASITFTDGGITPGASQLFIAKSGAVTILNPTPQAKLTSLKFNTANGMFTGTITGADPLDPWPSVTISGVVLPSVSGGAGYFMRPIVSPGQSWKTAPLKSGAVILHP
jgi:hypothetical protein